MKPYILPFIAALPAVQGCSSAKAEQAKPNVIFIIIDDSEFLEYGCYGGDVLTPNIDRLAQSGVMYTNGYTSTSISTPTRYTCITGQYASRAESLRTEDHQGENDASFIRWNSHVATGQHNIASVLQANGYRTGLAGKWHIGSGDYYKQNIGKIEKPAQINGKKKVELDDEQVNEYLRQRYEVATEDVKRSFGFDFVGGYYGGNLADIFPMSMSKFRKHNQDWITANAVEFIDESVDDDQPFFLYFSTTLQHDDPTSSILADRRMTSAGMLDEPVVSQPSGESIMARLEEAGLPQSAATSLWLDDGIGVLLDKLEQRGILDNTVIFFFSDQQSYGKSSCLDGGIRTPYIVSWPSKIAANQVCDELVSNIDFAPTIFDICGVTAPEDMVLDGESIMPTAIGGEPIHDALFFEIGNQRAVRTKDHKYIAIRRFSDEEWAAQPEEFRTKQYYRQTYFNFDKEWSNFTPTQINASPITAWRDNHKQHCVDADQLYDMRLDPSETMNLAENKRYQKVLVQMKGLLAEWLQTMPGTFGEFKE